MTTYPYVGPVCLRFKNRTGCVGALVLGDEVLLGVIPLEDMDLVVDGRNGTVDVNPASPNIASGICKRARSRVAHGNERRVSPGG